MSALVAPTAPPASLVPGGPPHDRPHAPAADAAPRPGRDATPPAPPLEGRRVAFIAGTLGQGGAERQLYYMLTVLRQHGARPRVLCLTDGEFWEAPIRALGVPVQHVGGPRSRLRRLARLIADLRADPVDVVQSQHFYTNLYAAAAGRVLGVPEVGALRSDVRSEVAANPGWLGAASLRVPRLLAANSARAILNAEAYGVPRARLRLLPNVVDVARFAPRPGGDAGPVRLLLAGRLGAEKRGDRFLRLVAAARAHLGAAVEGLVVGDGPERASLERQAAALGLLSDGAGAGARAGVTFHGAQADVAPWYGRASVLVLTSDFEGTPNVVLEAMAAGLPVVATDVGGVSDLVRDGVTGRTVPRDDEAALVDAVLALASDPARRRRYGAEGRRHVETHHALPHLADELRALYAAVAPAALGRVAGR